MMILFDTDLSLGTPGAEIDDGAALILLLRALGDQVKAVTTTHGNHDLEEVTQNTARMLALLNRQDIPLGRGAQFPLVEDKAWFAPWQAGYGHTPLWKVPELPRAVDLIINTVKANPGEVTLIAVGPLTNLALAARLAPEIVPLVKEVITMGGSFEQNEAQSEFNAHCDPEATQIALTAGWPVRTIGLNITHQVLFRRESFAALTMSHPAVTMLKSCAPAWISRVEAQGWEDGGCSLHDALAVAAYMDESLFTWQETGVSVELAERELRGMTRFRPVAPNEPSIRVATAVDAERVHDLIWGYIDQ